MASASTTPGAAATALSALGPSGDREYGFVVADLNGLPKNGLRYELVDGSIIVSPPTGRVHDSIGRWIASILEETNPYEEYWVGTDMPIAVDDYSEPRADVVVFDVAYVDAGPLPVKAVVLLVEVVSPVSALWDTEVKRMLYARAGVANYWIVVPSEDAPTIALAGLVLDPRTYEYRYATHFTTAAFITDRPWPVTVDLPTLSRRRARAVRMPVGTAEPVVTPEPVGTSESVRPIQH